MNPPLPLALHHAVCFQSARIPLLFAISSYFSALHQEFFRFPGKSLFAYIACKLENFKRILGKSAEMIATQVQIC
jgi:hypothetical protein